MDNEQNIIQTVSYQKQLIDKMRLSSYHTELRFNLLLKMLEEKNILASQELDKRWPLYLKNDIGAVGVDGVMEGSLACKFYGDN